MKNKVLIFDIETAPLLAYVWDRYDQNIGLNQIKDEWHVMAWAAKWLGDSASRILYRDQRNARNKQNDKAILKDLWKLLDQADIVLTQNGHNFDTPKLNARFILHGMNPPSPYKHLDTYQVVRRVAKFTSNSLEYLTNKLCTKYRKLKHTRFPGMTLWTECLAGNKAAWAEMRRYNIQDVLATEEFYNKIRAWAPANMPHIYNVADEAVQCATCGTTGKMQHQGSRVTKRGVFPRYNCRECGSWFQGTVAMRKAA